MPHWTLDDIPWHQFDARHAAPDMVSLAKAASMVEYNGRDYARYLREVFQGDEEFVRVADEWAEEEVQHGAALRRWAELADPAFDFDASFKRFTEGYKLPQNVEASVRGSRSGELIARCIVEVGTSSYYTAIKEETQEPVLSAIAARIAADEFRHYKLFYTHLQRYLEKEKLSFWQRLRVALSRIAESEDDELAYAWFASHEPEGATYNHARYRDKMAAATYRLYRRHHIERMVAMVLKAAGITSNGFLARAGAWIGWWIVRLRAGKFQTA